MEYWLSCRRVLLSSAVQRALILERSIIHIAACWPCTRTHVSVVNWQADDQNEPPEFIRSRNLQNELPNTHVLSCFIICAIHLLLWGVLCKEKHSLFLSGCVLPSACFEVYDTLEMFPAFIYDCLSVQEYARAFSSSRICLETSPAYLLLIAHGWAYTFYSWLGHFRVVQP